MGRVSRFVRVWLVGRVLKRNPLAAVLLALVDLLRRARRGARGIPFSPVRAGGYVGSDFLRRAGYVDPDAPTPAGELDDLGAFARPSFDPDAVAPAVRAFYERTGDYRMTYRVRWGRGFRLGARLVGPVTSRIRQLNLPGGGSGWRPLRGRFVAVDVPGDPREEVRGWVRENVAGEAVFVALYGAHEADGERFVNVAVPLPGGNLSTVLRPRNVDGAGDDGAESSDREDAVEWTTEGGGDPGLFLVTPVGAFRLPVGQRFVVRRADSDATGGNEGLAADAPLSATHEMWVLGATFLRIDYRIERREDRR
ncbi:hypothetical protein [Haloparvum sedimenti]|uniref:hypothetical protein n=1 Tax=Haloparvum sedimenti TaxID=1678448 RepID=UPI00071E862D|nr:hypothetical protein [Haloparvum sedimenti]